MFFQICLLGCLINRVLHWLLYLIEVIKDPERLPWVFSISWSKSCLDRSMVLSILLSSRFYIFFLLYFYLFLYELEYCCYMTTLKPACLAMQPPPIDWLKSSRSESTGDIYTHYFHCLHCLIYSERLWFWFDLFYSWRVLDSCNNASRCGREVNAFLNVSWTGPHV